MTRTEQPARCSCGADPAVVKCDFLPYGQRGADILGTWSGTAVYCAACRRIRWSGGSGAAAVRKWNEGETAIYSPDMYVLREDSTT